MKMKIGIVVLAVACVGLVIGLIATKKQAESQRNADAGTILEFSNQLTTANISIDDFRQVNLVLSNDLANSREQALTFSNNFAESSDALASTKTSLQGAMDQITNLNGRISDLEAQNLVLDQRANSLSNTIATLDSQITDTEQKLSTSETNNAFLTSELQRQMAEKAEMQRKFNDLTEVRDQVKKLRDELFVARRLQWMRAGIDPSTQQKGAEQLMQRQPAATATNFPPHYDLNVEVGSDGSVHVIPPLTSPPATTNSPSQ
jgi:chromosome segregation ATPase